MVLGIRRDANHGRTKNLAVENVAGLQLFENRVVRLVLRFDALDSVVKIGIEGLAFGFDFLQALLGQNVEELFANQLETLPKFAMGSITVRGNGAIEAIEDGEKVFSKLLSASMSLRLALAFGALAIIIEIGLQANQRVLQIGFFGGEFLKLVADYFFNGRASDNWLSFGRLGRRVFGVGF